MNYLSTKRKKKLWIKFYSITLIGKCVNEKNVNTNANEYLIRRNKLIINY